MLKDSKLVSDLQSHESKLQDAALEQLYFRNLPIIQSYILRNSGGIEDAQEVLQDALVIAFQSVRKPGFKLTAKLDTYLHGIAKNIWFNRLRKKGREINTVSFEEQDAHLSMMVPDKQTNTISERLLRLIQMMSPKCRNILTMIYVEEMDINETMVAMEYKSEQAVRNKKSICLQKLREQFLGTSKTTENG